MSPLSSYGSGNYLRIAAALSFLFNLSGTPLRGDDTALEPDLSWTSTLMLILTIGGTVLLWVFWWSWKRFAVFRLEYRSLVERNKMLHQENEQLLQALREKDVYAALSYVSPGEEEDDEGKKEQQEETGNSDRPAEATVSTSSGVLPIAELSHIWVEGNYIYYKHKDQSKYILQRERLKNAYARLRPHHFAQTHKSYVVNLAMVRQVSWKNVSLADGSKVPLSRTHKEEFRQAYQQYMQRIK